MHCTKPATRRWPYHPSCFKLAHVTRELQRPAVPLGLQRNIGLGQAVALYVSAILGAGVLVLPGQAATLAGPAALVAWGFSCVLGIPLALTFAALATRLPDAGGVSTYASAAFGTSAGVVAGWWYFTAGSVGLTIVPLTGGYYLAAAFDLDPGWSYLIALAILATAVASNLAGIRTSSRAQIGLAFAVGTVLLLASIFAIPRAEASRLTPFTPHGLGGIGSAVVILFFAFSGWEAVAHLAEEFHDSQRDLMRATVITIVVVTVLYLSVAAAVILTGTYGNEQLDHFAIGTLLEDAVGVNAAIGSAVLALIISLGTTNAFLASVSRLGYALARDGWFPRPLSRLTRRSTPAGSICLVASISAGGLGLAWIFDWGTEDIVYIPSTLIIVVYLLGTAAGVKLLEGKGRMLAGIGFVMTLCTLPSALGHFLVPVGTAVLALTYRWAVTRNRKLSERPTSQP
jgi:amino acid efflux transporter